jgi:hypothetical protein
VKQIIFALLFCLAPLCAHAQPQPSDILNSEDEVTERLQHYKWVRAWKAIEYDSHDRQVGYASGAWTDYLKDDGTAGYEHALLLHFKRFRVSYKSLESVGAFLPRFVRPGDEVRYVGRGGDLFTFEVRPKAGGFEGKVWTDDKGTILRAVGRYNEPLEPGMSQPVVDILMRSDGFPALVTSDYRFNGVRVTQSFRFEYHELRATVAEVADGP